MTRLHFKQGSSRRTSTLGLVLSLALIFGANGIIGVNATEPESPCTAVEETAESKAQETHTDSYTVSPAVTRQGHHHHRRNL